MCHDPTKAIIMKDFCELTCGYCGCSDTNYCRSFVPSSCTSPFYGMALRRDCPRLCNSCSSRINNMAHMQSLRKRSCSVDNGGCDSLCREFPSKSGGKIVKCFCYPGFILNDDETSCRDINECSDPKNVCATSGRQCVNHQGGFSCQERSCKSEAGIYNKYKSNECCFKEAETPCGGDITSLGSVNRRISGGSDAIHGAWPWMVQIWIDDKYLCGGTLISDEWVLSAAHCFDKITANSKIVMAFGRIKTNSTKEQESNVQFESVSTVVFNEEYTSDYFSFRDIVLVKLAKPVRLTNFVRPVCLPQGERPPRGTKCYAAGYGSIGDGVEISPVLQEVDLDVVSSENCNGEYPYVEKLVEDKIVFCAGNKQGKDTCAGDSGGPLMCQRCASCSWYLAGITSSGRHCGKTYGLYTDVETHERWIEEKTGIKINKDKECSMQYKAQWTGWTQWSECSKSCGEGAKRLRHRSCWHGDAGSKGCQGNVFETKKCDFLPCPDVFAMKESRPVKPGSANVWAYLEPIKIRIDGRKYNFTGQKQSEKTLQEFLNEKGLTLNTTLVDSGP